MIEILAVAVVVVVPAGRAVASRYSFGRRSSRRPMNTMGVGWLWLTTSRPHRKLVDTPSFYFNYKFHLDYFTANNPSHCGPTTHIYLVSAALKATATRFNRLLVRHGWQL